MTTIGVKSMPCERILPVNVPSYAYHYPSTKSVKLAAVKEGIFHPRLPSYRRMDMDTANSKLAEDHCRTSTSCSPGMITFKVTQKRIAQSDGDAICTN